MRCSFFSLVPAALATPLAAQNPAMTPPLLADWPGAEIADGVAFQADGSVTLEAGPGGIPVISFWRPILFEGKADKPVAGRMDCRVVATETTYSDVEFDADAKHAAVEEARKREGFKDQDILRDYGDYVRQLDVIGRGKPRRQQFVLSYILVRDGERLVDIRRNCTFVHGEGIKRPDVLPYVTRYTKFSYTFTPNDGSEGGEV